MLFDKRLIGVALLGVSVSVSAGDGRKNVLKARVVALEEKVLALENAPSSLQEAVDALMERVGGLEAENQLLQGVVGANGALVEDARQKSNDNENAIIELRAATAVDWSFTDNSRVDREGNGTPIGGETCGFETSEFLRCNYIENDSGISQVVMSRDSYVSAGQAFTIALRCPDGYTAAGGGWKGYSRGIEIISFGPTSDNGWYETFKNINYDNDAGYIVHDTVLNCISFPSE